MFGMLLADSNFSRAPSVEILRTEQSNTQTQRPAIILAAVEVRVRRIRLRSIIVAQCASTYCETVKRTLTGTLIARTPRDIPKQAEAMAPQLEIC